MKEAASGKLLCGSQAQYGSAARDVIGNESGFLVAMSQQVFSEPMEVTPGMVVTIEAEYAADQPHYGVMALWFLTLAGFNESCPGPNATGMFIALTEVWAAY